MRVVLVVTADLDEELADEAAQDAQDISVEQLVADEVTSNLESVDYVMRARVDRYLVPKLREHVDSRHAAGFYVAEGAKYRVLEAAEALVQWTRMGEGE